MNKKLVIGLVAAEGIAVAAPAMAQFYFGVGPGGIGVGVGGPGYYDGYGPRSLAWPSLSVTHRAATTISGTGLA